MLKRLVDALRREPYPLYALMRRVAPVVRVRGSIWAVFDHESVKRALHDPAVFSSRAAPPGGKPLDWMIFLDPPRHSQLRALVARTFTPRSIANLEPRIEAIVHGLIDEVIERGTMDLVTDFSERIPTLVIMEMLGLPLEDASRVTRWGDAIIHLGDTILGGEIAARASATYGAAKAEMIPYLDALVAARRAEPRDDLITRLVQAEVDGERLTDAQIFDFFQLLLLAGTETTTNLIANAVLCLLEHPAELACVRREPALLAPAIEEVLRLRSPLQMVFRSTTQSVKLRGKTIPAGQLVLVVLGSANRDPKQFRDPHRFDIGRDTPHVGFGHGIHFCIGAALARLEARVALGALLARVDDLRRASRAPWTPRHGINVLGPRAVPLRFTPGRRRAAANESEQSGSTARVST